MQMELPMFSRWHKCLDAVTGPIDSTISCTQSNPILWTTWCRMMGRKDETSWTIWTEKDVVDWVNNRINLEIKKGQQNG